jgi:hypothetical protein
LETLYRVSFGGEKATVHGWIQRWCVSEAGKICCLASS